MNLRTRFSIEIKKCTPDDWDYVLELRNEAREFFGNTDIVSKSEHYSYLKTTDARLWIAWKNNERMGFLKLNGLDLAIVLDKKFRKMGYGSHILRLGLNMIREPKFTAIIKKDNIASLKLYSKTGYVKTGEKDGMVLMEYVND